MESKTRSPDDAATDAWEKNLTCWRSASNPQCLRVETASEIHLFPYGYFQHAKFSRDGNKDVVQIRFQDQIVIVKGKGLEPLCAELERLAVERIRGRSEKYNAISATDGIIEEISIKKIDEIQAKKTE
jgi:hypothetical protein